MLSLLGAAGSGLAGSSSTEPQVPCFRLTVLGPESSGKTSLINSWVNNACPSAPAPTEATTFYYRMLRVQSPEDPNVLINGLVEVEDAVSWPLLGAPAGGTPQKPEPPWELPNQDDASKRGQPFVELRKYAEAKSSRPLQPLTGPAPRPGCSLLPGEASPAGLAHRRMGYLVVYDAHDAASLREALRILECFFPPPNGVYLGCVYLVANKIDKEHVGDAYALNVRTAQRKMNELYARWRGKGPGAEERVQQVDVSALEFTRVRKLFRDAVQSVSDRGDLHLARGTTAQTSPSAAQQGGVASSLLSLGGWWGGGGGGT